MSRIYAGIVSYNPDLLRLKENISSIQKQVPVILFDNGSRNIIAIQKLISDLSEVQLIRSKKILE